MKCKHCETRLKCQDSRQTDHYTRIREYACINCIRVYTSIEQLDEEPLNREAHKSRVKFYQEIKDVKRLHSEQK